MSPRALFILPDPEQPGLREKERLALRVRNSATITGRCACGAEVRFPSSPGSTAWVPMRHERDCPATSPIHERIARRLGDNVQWRRYVVELDEAKEPA